MSDFSAELDRIHASGKANGLLQAQVIALQYAVGAGPMSEFVARQIAEQIGQAASALQGNGPAQAVAETPLPTPTRDGNAGGGGR